MCPHPDIVDIVTTGAWAATTPTRLATLPASARALDVSYPIALSDCAERLSMRHELTASDPQRTERVVVSYALVIPAYTAATVPAPLVTTMPARAKPLSSRRNDMITSPSAAADNTRTAPSKTAVIVPITTAACRELAATANTTPP
jgi:hypothetical protein